MISSSPLHSAPSARSVLVPLDLNTLYQQQPYASTSSSSPSHLSHNFPSTSSSSHSTPQQNSTKHFRTDSGSSNFSTLFSNLDASSSRFDISSPPSSSATSSTHDLRSKVRIETAEVIVTAGRRSSSPNREVDGGSAFKKRKYGKVNLVSEFDTGRKVPGLILNRNEPISVFEMNRLRGLGLRVGGKNISMRPYLNDFVSHNEKEVFRCPSFDPNSDYTAPYTVAFTRGAKAGGKQTFAVGDHDGVVSFFDAGEDSQWHAGRAHNHLVAHSQAIFDILWSTDDQTIATTSGDSSAKLIDVETKQCLGTMNGHTGTIKKIDWHPSNPNLLSTASRDGSIRIWDRRVKGVENSHPGPRRGPQSSSQHSIATVNHIKNAHGTKGKPSKGFSATKSVTSLAFLPHKDTLLASAGSFDGTIKVWDLRRSHSRRVNPEALETNEEAITGLNLPRSHGIGSMCLSPNGQKLYAYSRDSKIYAFDPLNLSQPAPLSIFSDSRMTCESFYVHLSISPCSRYLASASSDNGVYLFDTEGSQQKGGIRLTGHEKETLSVDWGKDTIVSCSDDSLVRVWKYDSKNARKAREDPVHRWRWSGSEDDA